MEGDSAIVESGLLALQYDTLTQLILLRTEDAC